MMDRTTIEKAYVDWDFDDEEHGRYKFLVPRSEHDLAVGDKVTVRMLFWDEEQDATVDEVHDDGIVLKTDWIDFSEEYSIKKV